MVNRKFSYALMDYLTSCHTVPGSSLRERWGQIIIAELGLTIRTAIELYWRQHAGLYLSS